MTSFILCVFAAVGALWTVRYIARGIVHHAGNVFYKLARIANQPWWLAEFWSNASLWCEVQYHHLRMGFHEPY